MSRFKVGYPVVVRSAGMTALRVGGEYIVRQLDELNGWLRLAGDSGTYDMTRFEPVVVVADQRGTPKVGTHFKHRGRVVVATHKPEGGCSGCAAATPLGGPLGGCHELPLCNELVFTLVGPARQTKPIVIAKEGVKRESIRRVVLNQLMQSPATGKVSVQHATANPPGQFTNPVPGAITSAEATANAAAERSRRVFVGTAQRERGAAEHVARVKYAHDLSLRLGYARIAEQVRIGSNHNAPLSEGFGVGFSYGYDSGFAAGQNIPKPVPKMPQAYAAYARANDPTTSVQAAKSVNVGRIQDAIMHYLDQGRLMTGKQLAVATGIPLNSITPRFAQLRRAGLIEVVGKDERQCIWGKV